MNALTTSSSGLTQIKAVILQLRTCRLTDQASVGPRTFFRCFDTSKNIEFCYLSFLISKLKMFFNILERVVPFDSNNRGDSYVL